jgi:hypothetical protein
MEGDYRNFRESVNPKPHNGRSGKFGAFGSAAKRLFYPELTNCAELFLGVETDSAFIRVFLYNCCYSTVFIGVSPM